MAFSAGAQRRHTRDFFAQLADGTGMVVDVRPDGRVGERDAEAFAVTPQACGQVGWVFRRVGVPDATSVSAGAGRDRAPRIPPIDLVVRPVEAVSGSAAPDGQGQ